MAPERLKKPISKALIVLLGTSSTLGCSASDDYAHVPHHATHDGTTLSSLPSLPEAPEETVQAIRDCVKQHASSSGGDFVMDLRADVTRDGQAQTARIMSSNLRDADMEQCILNAVARMRVSPEILESSPTEPVSMSPQSRSNMGIAIPNPAIVLAGFMVIYGMSIMIHITLRVVLSSPSAPTIPAPMAATTTTTAPIATATTTTTAPPIPIGVPTTRYPNQTCSDAEMARLEQLMHDICDKGFAATCPSENELKRMRKKGQTVDIPCSAVLLSIPQRQACIAARWAVQNICFGGKPDDKHKKPIDDHQRGLDNCEALKLIVCAKGHPMAGK